MQDIPKIFLDYLLEFVNCQNIWGHFSICALKFAEAIKNLLFLWKKEEYCLCDRDRKQSKFSYSNVSSLFSVFLKLQEERILGTKTNVLVPQFFNSCNFAGYIDIHLAFHGCWGMFSFFSVSFLLCFTQFRGCIIYIYLHARCTSSFGRQMACRGMSNSNWINFRALLQLTCQLLHVCINPLALLSNWTVS